MTRIASQKAENKSQSIVGSLFRKNEDSSVNKNIVPSKLENTPAFNFGNINFHNSDDNSWIQPKLEINQPGDRYEQEADAMADKVMRMSDKDVAQNSYNTSGTTIQRKCAECEKEDEEKKVQRKESNNSSQSFAPPIVHKVLNSSAGKPMDINTRSFMESRFGYDFSHVRIHDNDKAAESANSINALAYTSGNNIVFNNGAYLPNMDSGKRLLAHELTHVMQQQSKSGNQIKLQCKSPNDKRRQERPSAISRISKLLSTSFWSFDFAVTDDEAREVLTILEGLEPVELMETIMKMRLSGAWKTLHQEVPDSDSGRLTEIEIKTDPNVGYIMFGDELKLKGWLPDEHKFQEFNVSVSINGIYLPILAPPIQVISLLPQDAVDTIAKSLENAKVCPWSALILSVVSRGIKYGHQSGPVRGEIPFNAKSIVPSPLSLSKQTNKKRDQFWAFYKSLSMRDEKDIIAGQFYIAQLDKSLINFKTPEELWTWALEESNKKTAPKREFLSWQATFKRNWEENIKKNPEEASYYHELYLKYTEWIVTHTEDDYRKYNAEAIAKQTIDYVFGKKWKQKELELRKQILEKQQKSSLDSPEFKENLDKVITIIELKILRTAPPQTAEDTTRGVGYLIEPSDTERTVRRIIADKMLHDYLDLTAKESKVDPELFVNHWLVSHPKEFETLMLVRAYPSVEKYDVPIEIPAYETVIEVGIGFIPIVGEIVGAYEVIAGEDLFGRKLSPQERAILGILILLPAAAKLFKVGKGAITASRLAREYNMTPKEADAAFRALSGIKPGTKGEALLREVEADYKKGVTVMDPKKLREINQLFEEMGVTERSTADALKTRSENPLADFHVDDESVDKLFEGAETERVKGTKKPTLAGKAVKTTQRNRVDIEDIFLRPGETQREALARVRTVIGRDLKDTPLLDAWNRARQKILGNRDISTITREEMIGDKGIYDQVRDQFWKEVRGDDNAVKYLNNAGFDFTSGNAPILQISAQDISLQELRISLDHKAEKAIGENWRKAVDADNFRFEFHNPNSLRESVQKKFPELRE